VCITSPTGGGKSELMRRVLLDAIANRETAILYTNRTLLLEQTIEGLRTAGIPFGVRSANHSDLYDPHAVIQLSMIQTEQSRVLKSKQWEMFSARRVLIDEAHNQAAGTAVELFSRHLEQGSTLLGYTATPLGIGHIYRTLVVAGKNSELRACGAHVPAEHYGCDEPDVKKIAPTKTGEYTEGDQVKAIMTPTIWGRVLEHWERLNPDRRPTILFAPGVAQSVYFAEQFYRHGVRVAHIDGEECWVNGERYTGVAREIRQQILSDLRTGQIQAVTNRFVMREGIDIPELSHLIYACLMGSVMGYLQSGGRVLRACHGKTGCTIQDHGGHWWRHGSLNEDRIWSLDQDARQYSQTRMDLMRDKEIREPITCPQPQCRRVRNGGKSCPYCGHTSDIRMRAVIQTDGTLKWHKGDIVKPRRVEHRSDTEQKWLSCFYRTKKRGGTLAQARGLFFMENFYYPPEGMRMMPKERTDWYHKINAVPTTALHTSKPE